MSVTNMNLCTHGPKKDCHACLVGEFVEAMGEIAHKLGVLRRVAEASGVRYDARNLSELEKLARAILEKAKLIEDCVPWDDAAEIAANQGHRW